MRKFIFTVLAVAVFFVGLGGLVEKTGAKFKSDERALEIIAQARQAIGGDAAIKNVRSLTINGNAAQNFMLDGVSRVEQGNLEINLQLPNQFSKMLQIGKDSAGAKSEIRQERHVILTTKDDEKQLLNEGENGGVTKIYVRKKADGNGTIVKDGDLPDGKQIAVEKNVMFEASHFRQNELFRTTFALLLSAPEGTDGNYIYAGVETIDGRTCDIISVENDNSSFKLFIDQTSHLPAMMSFQGTPPRVFKFKQEDESKPGDNATQKIIINKDDKVRVFTHKLETSESTGEFQIKFSDYRSVNGVQLPYKWTQTLNGQADQTVDIVNYEVNPANIADKFQGEKMMIRTKKLQ